MFTSPSTFVANPAAHPAAAACTPRSTDADSAMEAFAPDGAAAATSFGPSPAADLHLVPTQAPTHVVSQRANAWFFHDVARISRFFSANKYTCFVQDGVEHIATESLSSLERRLQAFGFMRAHRADLINLAHVTVVRRVRQTFEVTLADGQTVQTSRRLVRALRDKLAF